MIDHFFSSGELTGPLVDHLATYRTWFESHSFSIDSDKTISVPFSALSTIPIFAEDMHQAPSVALLLLSLAATQASNSSFPLAVRLAINTDNSINSITKFRELKASIIGKWGVFIGTVVKTSTPRPLVSQAAFECGKCGEVQVIKFKEGVFKAPTRCTKIGCQGKPFNLLRGCADTKYRNWQRIRIQEISGDDGDEEDDGRVPRWMEVELMDELVGRAAPGERVIVSGVVKVDEGEANSEVGKLAISYSLFLDCNNICHINDAQLVSPSIGLDEKITFPRLVASFCPSIYGHTMVKAGLLLALLGGRRDTSKRGDIHVLLLGDPGLGKSELLNAINKIAHRSVFVSANSATAAGLTATITQEPGVGEWGLEAGALVIADGGICCIDELDKAPEHKCLLEVMEQQQVNIAKAGVVCSLPARTSVIAAANPVNGHYNSKKSIHENVKLDSALLSRFDLLFLLLDRADSQLDRYLSERVIRQASSFQFNVTNDIFSADDEVSALAAKLSGNTLQMLNHEQLKSYIKRAREEVNPKMSDEAKEYIKEYYLEIRRSRESNLKAVLPTTIRQLEALVRLSEARARAELRALVTREDAADAVALTKFAISEFHSQFSPLSASAKNAGRPAGKGGQLKRFVTELQAISARTSEILFSETQLRQIHSTMQLTIEFRELIESLNHSGYLLRKGGSYKVLAAA